jgi:hypothetical protein
VLGATAAAIAAVVASVIFSTNIAGLVAEPSRFGWPYDGGVVLGFGYGGADIEAIAATLDRPQVEAWGIAATAGTATINDQSLPIVADVSGFEDLGMSTVEGALPSADDEVALGSVSARQVGVSVGDRVTVETDFGARDATVTGLVVLPAVGALFSDSAGLGTGILMSEPFFRASIADGEAAAGVEPGTFWRDIGGFVAIDLRDGTDSGQFMASIANDIGQWDVNGVIPIVPTRPVRSSQISDVAAMRSAPVLLAALIAAAMAVGLAVSVDRAARSRARELAVLHALGCTGRQLHATLRWQALTIVMIGLAVGVPAGLVIGRQTWRPFASGLGVVPTSTVPASWIAVIVGSTIGLALVAPLRPGRRTASLLPAALLREE